MPSSKIIHTKTGRKSATPHPDDLDFGELAINYNDGLLFFKNNSEKISILASSNQIRSINSHIGSELNPHKVTKAQVNLGFADNTSDLDKPISDLTAQALEKKVDNITLENEYYTKIATNAEIDGKFGAINIINGSPTELSPEGNLSYDASINTFSFTKPTLPTLADLGGLAIDAVKLNPPLAGSIQGNGVLSYDGLGIFTYDRPTIGGLGGFAKNEIGLEDKGSDIRSNGDLSYNNGIFTYDQPTISGLTDGRITVTDDVLNVDGYARLSDLESSDSNNDQTAQGLDVRITTNKENIESNDKDIADLDVRITTNKENIESNDSDIEELRDLIGDNDAAIDDLKTASGDASDQLQGLQGIRDSITDLSDNKANVSDLTTHINDENNPHRVTVGQLGLENVDNTSDANKPISDDTQAALDLKLNISDLPDTTQTTTDINTLSGSISDKADQSSLDTHTNNESNPHKVTAAQLGLEKVDNTSDANKPISNDTQAALDLKSNKNHVDGILDSHTQALDSHTQTLSAQGNSINEKATASDLNSHTNNESNPHKVTAAQLTLGNVDNTSDANKPISNDTQAALDLKLDANDSVLDGIDTNTQSINGLQSIVNTAHVAGRSSAKRLYLTGSPSSQGGERAEISLLANNWVHSNERNNAYYKAKNHIFTNTGSHSALRIAEDGTLTAVTQTIEKIEAEGDKAIATKEYVDSVANGDLVARTYVDDQVSDVHDSLSLLAYNMSLVAPGGSYIAVQRYSTPTKSDGSAFTSNWTTGATHSSAGAWTQGYISNGGFIFNSTGSKRMQAVNSNAGGFAMVNNISHYKSMTINVGYQFTRNTDDGSSFYMQYSIKNTNNVFDVTPGGSLITLSKAENVGGGWTGSQDQPAGWGVVHTHNSNVVVPPNSKIFFKFTAQINGGSGQYEGLGLRGFSITSPTWS